MPCPVKVFMVWGPRCRDVPPVTCYQFRHCHDQNGFGQGMIGLCFNTQAPFFLFAEIWADHLLLCQGMPRSNWLCLFVEILIGYGSKSPQILAGSLAYHLPNQNGQLMIPLYIGHTRPIAVDHFQDHFGNMKKSGRTART